MSIRHSLKLQALSTPLYWKVREYKRRGDHLVTSKLLRGRSHWVEGRRGLRSLWQLTRSSIYSLLVALSALLLSEYAAEILSESPKPLLRSIFFLPNSEAKDAVSTLTGGTVAVSATLLGLYYTTVGVISSTIYSNVPGEVRDLFIRERTSATYLKIVLFTLIVGIILLVGEAFGYTFSSSSLALLGILVLLTSVGLVLVTKQLFDYFDPSKLSGRLREQILESVRLATSRKTRSLTGAQNAARKNSYRALASYWHIVHVISDDQKRNARATVEITRQLLQILAIYSSHKYKIPTDSGWWSTLPKHQNWLAMDQIRLQMALNSSVGFQPDQQPDYLWFERMVAGLLRRNLRVAFASDAGANALSVSESVANLVGNLTARLQIDEAMIVEDSWHRVITEVQMTPLSANSISEDYEVRLNQMAAAESMIMPLTQMVLGLSATARLITQTDMSSAFESGIVKPDDKRNEFLPTQTRKVLEGFGLAIQAEVETEGKRITPAWWIDHHAARSLQKALFDTEIEVLRVVDKNSVTLIEELVSVDRSDLAAVVGTAMLELFDKLEFHEYYVGEAVLKLASFRHTKVEPDSWPERPERPFKPSTRYFQVLRLLSKTLPDLHQTKFDPREPDLYGQVYQFVAEGTFRAILQGDGEIGFDMYKALIAEMSPAQSRIDADLSDRDYTVRSLYTLDPVLSVLEVAGCAILMYELGETKIWLEMRHLWDTLLAKVPERAEYLLLVAQALDDPLFLSTARFAGDRRFSLIQSVFANHGVRSSSLSDFDLLDYDREAPHDSPLVSAIASSAFASSADLCRLFIVECVQKYLPEDAELGEATKSLATSIQGFRARQAHSEGGGDIK